jgi:hypothetical protein
VIVWLALRRLLPLLAVVSLAFSPVAAPAAMAGVHATAAAQSHSMAMSSMADVATDDMPCCPREMPTMPDCSKGCPLMALCLAKLVSGLPSGIGLPVRVAIVEDRLWGSNAPFDSLVRAPPPEPPRS